MTASDRERLGLKVTALVLALLLWFVIRVAHVAPAIPQERAQPAAPAVIPQERAG